MAYNAANQICWASNTTSTNGCATPPSGATTYTFDADGNELGNSAGLALSYNARNQTTGITSGDTANPLTYLGGSQNELTTVGSTSILNNLLGPSGQTNSGQTTADTRDVSSNLLDERTPTATDSYLQDGLGSVVGVGSTTGTLLDTATYDPYGQVTASSGTTRNPFGYASGLQVPGGLVKYDARYYDPSIARWTQLDPLVNTDDPADADAYSYAGGDPVNLTDPSGLCVFFSCSVYHKINHALGKAVDVATSFQDSAIGGSILGCASLAAEYVETVYGAGVACIVGAFGAYEGVDLAEGVSHAHQNRPGG